MHTGGVWFDSAGDSDTAWEAQTPVSAHHNVQPLQPRLSGAPQHHLHRSETAVTATSQPPWDSTQKVLPRAPRGLGKVMAQESQNLTFYAPEAAWRAGWRLSLAEIKQGHLPHCWNGAAHQSIPLALPGGKKVRVFFLNKRTKTIDFSVYKGQAKPTQLKSSFSSTWDTLCGWVLTAESIASQGVKQRVLQLSPVQWLQQEQILRDRNLFSGGEGEWAPDKTGNQVKERGCKALTHYLIYIIIIYTTLHLKYKNVLFQLCPGCTL